MASDSADLHRRLLEGSSQRDHLHRLVGEMNAEMMRLAAEAAVGPPLILSKDLEVRRCGRDPMCGRQGRGGSTVGSLESRERMLVRLL